MHYHYSHAFVNFAGKREQRKFTFYAEREQNHWDEVLIR